MTVSCGRHHLTHAGLVAAFGRGRLARSRQSSSLGGPGRAARVGDGDHALRARAGTLGSTRHPEERDRVGLFAGNPTVTPQGTRRSVKALALTVIFKRKMTINYIFKL